MRLCKLFLNLDGSPGALSYEKLKQGHDACESMTWLKVHNSFSSMMELQTIVTENEDDVMAEVMRIQHT